MDNDYSDNDSGPKLPKMPNITIIAAVFYSLLILVTLPLLYWREGQLLPSRYWRGDYPWYEQVVLGLIFAIVFILIAIGARHWFEWVRRAESDLRQMLGWLSWWQILIIALCSGIGEELFFRGLLQPWLGLWLTSILFGIAHPPATPNLFFYPFLALIVALGLGWMFQITGQSLLAPCTAHFVINMVNLYRIVYKNIK